MGDEICRSCGTPMAVGQRFCGSCGASRVQACPSCGHANPPGFRFCGGCGAALHAASPTGPAVGATATEERRWVSVLFADLSGFTALSEDMDPEDVRAMVDGCMGQMTSVVERHGASQSRVIGDELMVIFGAPVTHEDDAERAVRSALALQECARRHAKDFGGLSLRVGVNTGEVMYGTVGGDARPTVMGDVVNTASRLESAAPPGGVLVGEETWRATERAISYQAVEPLQVKGKGVAVRAYLAVEPLGGPGERPLSGVPLVGRAYELGVLHTAWQRVAARRIPQLVTVPGPPGIGKTRLAREFAGLVEGAGGRVLSGRSLPYGESTGYGAFAQQLKGLAGIFENEPAPVARKKLQEGMAALLPPGSADEVASHLALMTGLGAEGVVADRAALLLSARRFVEALATEQPTVLVFEDLHWADPSLLDLVETLASRCREVPLLLLTLARPELFDRRPGWGGGLTSHTTLELRELLPADARDLLTSLLPGITDPAMVARLVERASGNPLFLEELGASFYDRATEMAANLPTSVKAIIAARLDALPGPERQVLLDAAVVGSTFWPVALECSEGEAALAGILDSLEARGLVARQPGSSLEGIEEFAFKHMLIREVAYATLSKAARRTRHAAVARFIEEAAGDRTGEWASLLAHHWSAAGDTERTVRHLLAAADHAARAWAIGEARALYAQALELVPEDRAAQRRSIRLRRAGLYVQDARYSDAIDELDGLLPELEGRELAEALVARARCAAWGNHDAATALALARQAVEMIEAAGDQELLGPALSMLSFASSLQSGAAVPEAVRVGERALEVWPVGRRKGELAMHLAALGLQSYFLARYDETVEHGGRAYRLAKEINATAPLVYGGAQLGLALIGLGRHEEAFDHLAEVVRQGKELGTVPPMTCRSMNIWAGGLRELHDLEAARRLNHEARDFMGLAPFPTVVVQADVDLLFTDLVEGEVGRAKQAWPRLWEAAQGLRGFHQWLVAGRLEAAWAEVLLAAGDWEGAVGAASRAAAGARAVFRLKYEVASRGVLGSALLELRRHDEALTELRWALEGAQRLKHPPSVWRWAAGLGTALYAAGDDGGAEAASTTARATIETFAAGLSEARRAPFLAAPAIAGVLAGPG